MIIKKNQTINKKPIESNESDESQNIVAEVKSDLPAEVVPEEFNIEQIAFGQREERREGTRRRGYRRIDDRNIISRAQEEALTIRDDAYTAGYNKGIESAKEELKKLNLALEEFFNYKQHVIDKLSEPVYDIAVKIAEKIIKKQVDADKDVIISMIKDILNDINRHENRITIHVRKEDVQTVKDKLGELFPEGLFEAKILVVEDKDIIEGGVVVETSNGVVDGTISTQMEIIKNTFKSA